MRAFVSACVHACVIYVRMKAGERGWGGVCGSIAHQHHGEASVGGLNLIMDRKVVVPSSGSNAVDIGSRHTTEHAPDILRGSLFLNFVHSIHQCPLDRNKIRFTEEKLRLTTRKVQDCFIVNKIWCRSEGIVCLLCSARHFAATKV